MRYTSDRRAGSEEDEVLRLVQQHAPELLRFARRYSICADDAHDAYQRGIEILVRRMRTAPPEQPLSWVRTVIKHEAAAVRAKREELVGRLEADLDRHEARHLEDPAERAVGFERLRHTAEALQRLKPNEMTALVLRAEGLTYKEICARLSWTYTMTNRSITEGRRALLERLGAIESGAECDRWLPLLSVLADGEASAVELAELRPHLRTCAACRATLRRFHDAPGEVAALVPPVVVAGLSADHGTTLVRHAEALVHGLLGRAALAVARVQGGVDALPGAKLAAVAASSVAIAGGGVVAVEQATRAPARPQAARVSAPVASGVAARPPAALVAGTASFPPERPSAAEFGTTRGPSRGGTHEGEFAPEGHAGAVAPPAVAHRSPPAPAAAPAAATSSSTPSQHDPPAEFAGP